MAKKDKNEDEYKDNLENSSMQDDEDFGLPDLDDESTTDQPNQDEEVEIEITTEEKLASETITFEDDDPSDSFDEEQSDSDYVEEEEDYELEEEEQGPVGTYTPPKQSSAPIIITLSIIVILACIAVYFFFIYEGEPKNVKATNMDKDTTTYVVEKPVEVVEPVIEETEPVKETATINTLKVRSGRSYVVVGSFFDDDLAMDYAKELKSKGTTSYVIPPFGKSKFTRVAVKESASFADASSMANELAGQYKEQPWPLKY